MLDAKPEYIARLAPQCRPLASSSEPKQCYHLANVQRMHVVPVCLDYANIIQLYCNSFSSISGTNASGISRRW